MTAPQAPACRTASSASRLRGRHCRRTPPFGGGSAASAATSSARLAQAAVCASKQKKRWLVRLSCVACANQAKTWSGAAATPESRTRRGPLTLLWGPSSSACMADAVGCCGRRTGCRSQVVQMHL